MEKGRTYWITGLPGSGKTMIGTTLYYELKKTRDNVVILDGDILKKMVGDVVGYTKEDRLSRGKRYSNVCKLLTDQGLWVIICTVAMFEEIRKWNRENIAGYIEIFVNPPLKVLKERNRKNLYNDLNEKEFFQMELPSDSDLVLENEDGASMREHVKKIIELIPRKENDFDRDTAYWNRYYKMQGVQKPSPFACYVLEERRKEGFIKKLHMLELGCGNGRDSEFFISNGYRVTGVDASEEAITTLQKRFQNVSNARFICDDFIKSRALFQTEYDIVYMRWVLHAISLEQEEELFQYLKDALSNDGRIYIEARTTHDDLFGQGKPVGKNAFVYHGHYRRFINVHEFQEKLKEWGYSVILAVESKGLSKTKNEDPMLCRFVLSLPCTN